MARILFVLAALTLLLPAAARAEYEQPKLAGVASVFAMEPVTVTCAEKGEDWLLDTAWGYVFLSVPVVHMPRYLCDAAANVTDNSFGLARRALAVLVTIHEAYHLRTVWAGRSSEAETECKAIRHFRVGAMLLGASPELATQLRVYALAFHWRLAARIPEYHLAGCKVTKP